MSVRAACSEDGCAKGGWEVKEHRVFTYRPADKKLHSAVSGEIAEGSLRKPTQEPPCWLLARVFKDAGYGGDDFTFSQAAGTPGYYHKVIWDLTKSQSCCEESYPGGFNDCISSHSWIEDVNLGYNLYSIPVNMKVWKHANRQGPSEEFDAVQRSGHWECYDPNYADNYWGFPPETINDKVSSIDMFYQVARYQ
ncbi:MAG: hypothetical protein H5U38_14880 [Calditrichaeota bacterium]|nr:hypothetical protein [Calditrichota bacterium]